MKYATLLLAVALTPLFSQELVLPPNMEVLAQHAKESVKVTLDGSLLQLAARMIPDDDPHSGTLKKIIAGIQGIYVRSFEFDSDGVYSAADLEQLKAQFKDPSWARIVSVVSKEEGDCDVYIR